MKKLIRILSLSIILILTSVLVIACDDNPTQSQQNEFLSAGAASVQVPKTEYHKGDQFSYAETYIRLCYIKNEQEIDSLNYNLGDNTEGFKIDIVGFNSSVPVESQTVTIKVSGEGYKGEVSTSINVKILPAYLLSTTIKVPQTAKTEYQIGEGIDLTDFYAEKLYSDGTKDNYPITSDMVAGFDSSSAIGQRQMIITYDSETCKIAYSVSPGAGYVKFTDFRANFYYNTEEFNHSSAVVGGGIEIIMNYFKPDGTTSYEFKSYKTACSYNDLAGDYYFKFSLASWTSILSYDPWGPYSPVVDTYTKEQVNGTNAFIANYTYLGFKYKDVIVFIPETMTASVFTFKYPETSSAEYDFVCIMFNEIISTISI